MTTANDASGLSEKLRPIHRIIIAICLATVTYFLLPGNWGLLIRLLISWSALCIVYLFICWWLIISLNVTQVKKIAAREDGSKIFVFTMILLGCLACYCAVFFVMVSGKKDHLPEMLKAAVTFSSMMLSWVLIHTVFTFHYARMYYRKNGVKKPLDFPGDDPPDYFDFAYFSFVMGCTFQVSDVTITNKQVRRLALFHGLLSFGLNTFVIALSINIISGMVQ